MSFVKKKLSRCLSIFTARDAMVEYIIDTTCCPLLRWEVECYLHDENIPTVKKNASPQSWMNVSSEPRLRKQSRVLVTSGYFSQAPGWNRVMGASHPARISCFVVVCMSTDMTRRSGAENCSSTTLDPPWLTTFIFQSILVVSMQVAAFCLLTPNIIAGEKKFDRIY